MRPTTRTALIALAIGVALTAQARAQTEVHLFEESPSIEELRAILIPESHGGLSRRIEFPHKDALDAGKPVQPAAASAATAAPPFAEAPAPAAEPKAPPATAKAAPAKPTPEAAAAVGFRINFAFNSAVIPSEHIPHLDRIVDLMREEPALWLKVEGHTDAVGTAEYNMDLSRRRAVAVVRYLIEHGVEANRLTAVGKGKTEPLVADPMDGRNRRVQFLRLNTEQTS